MKSQGLINRLVIKMSVITGFGLGLLLVWFLGVQYSAWLQKSELFSIDDIQIEGNDFVSTDEILTLGNMADNQSIWQVNLVETQSHLESHPFLQKVFIKRFFPSTLQIGVEEKRPVALLKCEDQLFCIDGEAMVLPSKPGKLYNLPIISGDFKGGVSMGHKAKGARIVQGLTFLKNLQDVRPELFTHISEVVVGMPEGILLYTTQKGIPVWVGNHSFIQKLCCLDAILKELAKNGEMALVCYIDLRFEGQVIVGMRV
jgi:cell division septal protein FtsQ